MDKKLKVQSAVLDMTILVITLGTFSFITIQYNILALLTIVFPLAFGLYAYKHDIRFSILSIFIVSLVLALLPDWMWLNILLIAGPIGVVIGYVTKRKLNHGKSTMIIVGSSIALSAIWYFVISEFVLQMDLLTLVKEYVMAMPVPPELLESFSEAQTDTFMNIELEAKQLLLMVLPSLVLGAMALYSLLNFVLLDYVLNKLRKETNALPPLYEMRLPDNIIMGTTIVLVLTLIAAQVISVDSLSLMVNVMYIVMLTFTMQGLAVLSFYLKKLKLVGIIQLPILIIGLVIFQFVGLSLMGWLDAIFDLRQLKKKNVGGV
ncbi:MULTISPECIES: DUF2232 domain-containing protein [unclassified Fusibacter]|uniref:DUF2232 domain-containing protein n=1 Tax=unclassified Fusibacter TaxID=2624464 RepID=UPI001010B21C|nr:MULTISPECIES: DUF2232 domain-containing protein [unclassified Fusibacter]MCK8060879.1 YybS family protein [Fusibacter sp. A2]NPE23175.1 DUF2232 domain-containing protein [Fusibacter sp. A1]RXV59533.1 DUF2232 domain-containing protein [Fusibacter sp. A1]